MINFCLAIFILLSESILYSFLEHHRIDKGQATSFCISCSKKRKWGMEKESGLLSQKQLPHLTSLNSAEVSGFAGFCHLTSGHQGT